MVTKQSVELIEALQKWFDKAPALPTNAKDILVRITPIVVLIFGILGIVGALAGLGALTVLAPFSVYGGTRAMVSYGNGFIATLIWLGSAVLLLAAFPGTRARKLQGWTFLFWSEVVSLIGSFVAFSFFSGVIGALIGFYLLFQIKSHYK